MTNMRIMASLLIQTAPDTAPLRGIYDVHPTSGKVRRGHDGGCEACRPAFAGTVCAFSSSFLGSSQFPQSGVISSRRARLAGAVVSKPPAGTHTRSGAAQGAEQSQAVSPLDKGIFIYK